jgi:hypothetical protein
MALFAGHAGTGKRARAASEATQPQEPAMAAERPVPVSFSDEELATVQAAAAPLPAWMRGPFLDSVAQELAGKVRSAGVVYRICADLQRQYINNAGPPDVARGRGRQR